MAVSLFNLTELISRKQCSNNNHQELDIWAKNDLCSSLLRFYVTNRSNFSYNMFPGHLSSCLPNHLPSYVRTCANIFKIWLEYEKALWRNFSPHSGLNIFLSWKLDLKGRPMKGVGVRFWTIFVGENSLRGRGIQFGPDWFGLSSHATSEQVYLFGLIIVAWRQHQH